MSKMKMALAAGLAVLAGVVGAFGGPEKAQAACATYWEMGDKSVLFCGGSLEDGTFTAELTGDDENGYVSTVTLRNYKGPAFVARTYGTGVPVKKFIVELEGLNEVTLEDFEQFYMGGVEYELVGEGRLVVKAPNGSSDGSEGTFGAQTNCENYVVDDVFGVEDAVTWVVVRVGIIGGVVAVVAAVAFGVVKLVQEVKKSTK